MTEASPEPTDQEVPQKPAQNQAPKPQNNSGVLSMIVIGITALLVTCCALVFTNVAANTFNVHLGIGPKFALILATVFFALASIFGMKGALIFFYFGPAHLVQHLQIEKALKILEGKMKTDREIEFMQGQKIYSAWKPSLILLLARLFYDFGGNEVILGWVFIFCVLYMVAIMGIDAGRILLVAIPVGILFLGYFLWNEIERAQAITEFWQAFNQIVFESGMKYIPLVADIIVGFVACLIVISLGYHKFFDLNFGFYRNQFTVGIFVRRSRTFPREQIVLDNDVPDAFEDLLDRMSTILYIGVQSGIDSHFFYCVPFGNKVRSIISRATSRQRIVEG